jgi:DNA-binding MarR family transcriptional regulator
LLQVNVRLRLDEVADIEAEQLRLSARRQPTKKELEGLARRIYQARRLRGRVLRDQIFGEPAWDMLLELYRSGSSINALSYAANCAPTTGLRWQKVLTEQGLIERGPPGAPAQKQLVRLTDEGRKLMDSYLTRLFYSDNPNPPNSAHGLG